MYVLKKYADNVDIPDTNDFSRNPETFEWKFNNYYRTFEDKEFTFEEYQQHQSYLIIHDFLINNVKGKINYNVDQFLIRTSYGYASSQGVFSVNYQLNILGWNKLKMNEQEPFSEVFNSYNNHLMNLMYTLAKVWLQSFVQFPHTSPYIQGVEKTNT